MVWASDEKVARNCTWEPLTNKEDGLNYLRNDILPHPWFRAICLDDRPIGAILVNPNTGNIDKLRAKMGYYSASEYWGKGIATRAVKMVANTIFADWPHLERLEALVDVYNLGSRKVLQKAGFQREGVLRKHYTLKGISRDWVMFSLLSTDPQP